MLFVVKDFLSYTYLHFPKLHGYIGFSSGGFCHSPAVKNKIFTDKDPMYSAGCYDQSGYFNPKCRPWYIETKKNPNKTVMLDLYADAGSQALIGSVCTDLQDPKTGDFYGALCQDIDMNKSFFTRGTHIYEHLGPQIYE